MGLYSILGPWLQRKDPALIIQRLECHLVSIATSSLTSSCRQDVAKRGRREGEKGRNDGQRKPGQILFQLSLSLLILVLRIQSQWNSSEPAPHSALAPSHPASALPLSSTRNWEIQIPDSAFQLSTLGMLAYLSLCFFLSFFPLNKGSMCVYCVLSVLTICDSMVLSPSLHPAAFHLCPAVSGALHLLNSLFLFSTYLPTYLHTYRPTYHLSTCLSIIYLSVIYLSIYHLSTYVSIYLSIYLSIIYLSIYLSHFKLIFF